VILPENARSYPIGKDHIDCIMASRDQKEENSRERSKKREEMKDAPMTWTVFRDKQVRKEKHNGVSAVNVISTKYMSAIQVQTQSDDDTYSATNNIPNGSLIGF